MVPGHAGIPGNKHADSLSKAGASLPASFVLCPSPQLSPKPVTTTVTNGDVAFSHFFYHLNCTLPTVSPEELVFSRLICFEVFVFASMAKPLTIVVGQP